MSLFDVLVDEAIRGTPEITTLRPVVEKELLHHDILRLMSESGQLARLVFMGGTCLRACYGSERLSEDLDFAGGPDFSPSRLPQLARSLMDGLQEKYGLPVNVSEPFKETGNTDTWKVKVQTRPERKDMKAQVIHIDICAVPSHEARPMMLRDRYAVDMGTSGLILQARSRREILADKYLALALRPNRLKNRDLWDIAWLQRLGESLDSGLVARKLIDHRSSPAIFLESLDMRIRALAGNPSFHGEFRHEMQRFLPAGKLIETALSDDYWRYLMDILAEDERKLQADLSGLAG